MFIIKFNNITISSVDTEEMAIALALNLHKSSNVPHNIIVTKNDVTVLSIFNDVPDASV